jgi:hypothetical protein
MMITSRSRFLSPSRRCSSEGPEEDPPPPGRQLQKSPRGACRLRLGRVLPTHWKDVRDGGFFGVDFQNPGRGNEVEIGDVFHSRFHRPQSANNPRKSVGTIIVPQCPHQCPQNAQNVTGAVSEMYCVYRELRVERETRLELATSTLARLGQGRLSAGFYSRFSKSGTRIIHSFAPLGIIRDSVRRVNLFLPTKGVQY